MQRRRMRTGAGPGTDPEGNLGPVEDPQKGAGTDTGTVPGTSERNLMKRSSGWNHEQNQGQVSGDPEMVPGKY